MANARASETEQSIIPDILREFVGREMNAHSDEISEKFLGPWDTELPELVEITRPDLKRWMNVTGNPNPRFETEAPPTYVVNLPMCHRMVQSILYRAGRENFGMVGGQEIDYYAPMRVGDVISSTGKLLSVEERTSRRGEKVGVTVYEVRCTNQRNEPTVKHTMTTLFMRGNYPQSPGEDTPRPRPLFTGQVSELLARRGLLEVVKRKQLAWGEVKEGDPLPAQVQPITSRRLVRWGLISCDYTEHHYDVEVALERGMPRCVVHGAFTLTFLGRLVTDWMGNEGTLKKLKTHYRRAMYVGDDILCEGRVHRKYVENGEHYVDLELSATNPKGVVCATGRAVVVLPK